MTAEQVAEAIGAADEVETIYKVLEHVSANVDHAVTRTPGKTPTDATFSAK